MKATTTHLTKRTSVLSAIGLPLLTLAAGMGLGWLAGANRGYAGLNLPPFSPPDLVFPIVWGVLYLMMGFALHLLVQKPAFTPQAINARKQSLTVWGAQMAFNLCWLFAFFTFRLYIFSFVWLAILAAVNLALILHCFRFCAPAGFLLLPYEVWLLFAVYLNLGIALLN